MSVVALAFLAVQGAAVVFVTRRVTAAIVGDDGDMIDRATVGGVIAFGTVCAVLEVLGAVGLLSRVPVLVAHGAIAAAATLLPAPRRSRPLSLDRPAAAVASAGALFGTAVALVGLRGASREYDTVHYHAAVVISWLQAHRLTIVPFSDPGFFVGAYPGNAGLLALWTMVPGHTDVVAYVTPMLFAALAVCAGARLARALGASAWSGALAALAVCASPLVAATATRSLMNDLPAAALLVTSLSLVVQPLPGRDRRTSVAVAGLAVGLAAGTKYTVLVPAAGLLVLVAWHAPVRARMQTLVTFVVTALAGGGFWFVRNALLFGNPLFPQAVLGLPSGTSAFTALDTTLLDQVRAGNGTVLSAWAADTLRLVGPAAAIVAIGMVIAVARGHRGGRVAVAVTLLTLWCAAAYAITPTTGGGPDGLRFLVASNLRYALPALLLGAAVAAACLPTRLLVALGGVAVVWDAVRMFQGPGFRSDIDPRAADLAVAAVVAALTWVAVLGLRPRSPSEDMPAPRQIGDDAAVLVHDRTRRSSRLVATALVTTAGAIVAVIAASRAVAPAGPLAGTAVRRVAVAGVADVRALFGPGLDIDVVALGGGDHHLDVLPTADGFTRAVAASGADAVVVGDQTISAPPPGWNPGDGWTQLRRDGVRVYVRVRSD